MDNFVKHLKALGVEDVYFCSGSRNHSLKSSLSKHFNMYYHFDERVSSFMALGNSKQSGKPTVVCTTSGTAVAECLPAMIEAYHSHQKLIMISADRPARLRNSGAPQAINQLDIFKGFKRFYFSGTLDEYGDEMDKGTVEYPFHINLEIDDASKDVPYNWFDGFEAGELVDLLNKAKNPLVIFSEKVEETNFDFKKLWHIFNELGYYLYKECTANIKNDGHNEIFYDHTLVKHLKNHHFDLVLKIGHTPISKIWRLLDNTYPEIPVVSFGGSPGLAHAYIADELIDTDIKDLKSKSVNKIEEVNILNIKEDYPRSEITIFDNILDAIDKGSYIFLGNSMPIRYGQLLRRKDFHYIAQRGANGIDGQIAHAIGVSQKAKKDVHLIIGDLTFLYDLSALLIKLPENLTVHVLNNNGGRIFERIGIKDEIINEHSWDIKKIAHCFNEKQIKIYEIDNQQTNAYWEAIL